MIHECCESGGREKQPQETGLFKVRSTLKCLIRTKGEMEDILWRMEWSFERRVTNIDRRIDPKLTTWSTA